MYKAKSLNYLSVAFNGIFLSCVLFAVSDNTSLCLADLSPFLQGYFHVSPVGGSVEIWQLYHRLMEEDERLQYVE